MFRGCFKPQKINHKLLMLQEINCLQVQPCAKQKLKVNWKMCNRKGRGRAELGKSAMALGQEEALAAVFQAIGSRQLRAAGSRWHSMEKCCWQLWAVLHWPWLTDSNADLLVCSDMHVLFHQLRAYVRLQCDFSVINFLYIFCWCEGLWEDS